jgi:hypothetical protein
MIPGACHPAEKSPNEASQITPLLMLLAAKDGVVAHVVADAVAADSITCA